MCLDPANPPRSNSAGILDKSCQEQEEEDGGSQSCSPGGAADPHPPQLGWHCPGAHQVSSTDRRSCAQRVPALSPSSRICTSPGPGGTNWAQILPGAGTAPLGLALPCWGWHCPAMPLHSNPQPRILQGAPAPEPRLAPLTGTRSQGTLLAQDVTLGCPARFCSWHCPP